MNVNKIHIIGRLGKDTDLKYTPTTGNAICRVSVAVNRPGKSEETDWFNVAAWGKTGEFLHRYGRKGRLVYVEGRMQQNHWTDAEGQSHTMWELVANQIQFLDRRPADAPDDTDEPDI